MFNSNAVRSCVELHETELRRFCDVWETFRASGTALPESDDPSYRSVESRWGEDYTIEQMLEHAIVHPMRHRIQLERLMSAPAGVAPA